MPETLAKDDPAPLLGPPRNALLWMRAKDMAGALGRGADFQTILQMYQMFALAPGFGAVSKAGDGIDWKPPEGVRDACRRGLEHRKEHGGSGLTSTAVRWAGKLARGEAITPEKAKAMHAFHARHAVDERNGWGSDKTPGYVASLLWGHKAGKSWAAKLRRQMEARKSGLPMLTLAKANMGRKKPGGGRVGAWKWAQETAKRRGKPKAYAVALLRRVMKSLPALDAANRLNHSGQLNQLVGAMAPAPTDGYGAPVRRPVDLDEAVRDLPLHPDQAAELGRRLGGVLDDAPDHHAAASQSAAVCQDYPEVGPPLRQELARVVAFLHRLNNGAGDDLRRGMDMPLTLRKAGEHAYVSRKQGPHGWIYTYASGKSAPAIGHTQSGHPIHASESGAYAEAHATRLDRQHEVLARQFPHYGKQDHLDAAAAHREDFGKLSGRFNHLIADAHEEAAGKAKKSMEGRMTLRKAQQHKYVSRKQGPGGRWTYTYAEKPGGPKITTTSHLSEEEHRGKAAFHQEQMGHHLASMKAETAKMTQYGSDTPTPTHAAHFEQLQAHARLRDKHQKIADRMLMHDAQGRIEHETNRKSLCKQNDMKKADYLTGISFAVHKSASGPGSRGGHVIGHTRSGKPVYATGNRRQQSMGFSGKDHEDAEKLHLAAHEKMYARGAKLAERGKSAESRHAYAESDRHKARADGHGASAWDRRNPGEVAAWKNRTGKDSTQGAPTRKSEGSRGGHVIGHTRAGKPIYELHGHAGHASFSAAEHKDAATAHNKLARKEANRADFATDLSDTDEESDSRLASDHHRRQASLHMRSSRRMTSGDSGIDSTKGHVQDASVGNDDAVKDPLGKAAGDRGGHVIGTTRSGKPVYASHDHPAHAGFTASDHRDAASINRSRAARARSQIRAPRRRPLPPMEHNAIVADYSRHSMASVRHARAAQDASTSGPATKSKHQEHDMKKADDLTGISFSPNAIPVPATGSQEVDGLAELQATINDFESANVGGTQGASLINWAITDSTETGVDGASATSISVDKKGNAPSLPFGDAITVQKSLPDGLHGVSSPMLSTLNFFAQRQVG